MNCMLLDNEAIPLQRTNVKLSKEQLAPLKLVKNSCHFINSFSPTLIDVSLALVGWASVKIFRDIDDTAVISRSMSFFKVS